MVAIGLRTVLMKSIHKLSFGTLFSAKQCNALGKECTSRIFSNRVDSGNKNKDKKNKSRKRTPCRKKRGRRRRRHQRNYPCHPWTFSIETGLSPSRRTWKKHDQEVKVLSQTHRHTHTHTVTALHLCSCSEDTTQKHRGMRTRVVFTQVSLHVRM